MWRGEGDVARCGGGDEEEASERDPSPSPDWARRRDAHRRIGQEGGALKYGLTREREGDRDFLGHVLFGDNACTNSCLRFKV